MHNKRLAINMIASLFSFVISMGISFVLSPYIINTVGSEAYGFVNLANNFVSYGQLITLALNSMASRFITIRIHKGDEIGANKYFTSVIIVNIITSIILCIPSIYIINNLQNIVNIPQEILVDVKILWAFIFINFLISLVLGTFNLATFVVNRLDLSSIRDIQANIMKVVILIISFSFFIPRVWYIGLASIICTIFLGIYNIYYKYKLLPELHVKLKYFDLYAIKELFISGIWNVVIKLGQILSDGLDLLITNIFIGAGSMGILSIAKTVPMAIGNLLGTVSGVFNPQLTYHFAKEDKKSLVTELSKSMKMSGLFTNIPLVFLCIFGFSFYSLWVPTENTELIQFASILTVYGSLFSGVINPLFNVFTITNKLKVHSIVILLNGFINTLLVFILLKTTNLGILAVAGISSTTCTIRNLTYTVLYASHCLEIKKTTFYPIIGRYILSTFVMLVIFSQISRAFFIQNWLILIIVAFICGIVGLLINYCLLLDKAEKVYFKQLILKLLKRKEG